MIPTRYKTKLPRTHSYPIGAEAVSEALYSSRLVEPCSLSFTTERIRPRDDQSVYRIFQMEYSPARKPGRSAARWTIESGLFDTHWKVTVFAVPRKLRHRINRLLLEKGLPETAVWLESSEQKGWKSRYHRIEFFFNALEESFLTQQFTSEDISPAGWLQSC